MKWLHLSDIHFNPSKDGADSIYLRNRLLEFLRQKNISVDKMFITEILEMQVVKKEQMRRQRILQIIYQNLPIF